MNLLLVLPIAIPLMTASFCLLAWRQTRWQRALTVVSTALVLGVGSALLTCVWRDGIAVTQAGAWPAPFGITLVADVFSAMMVVLTGLIGLAVALYSLANMDAPREAYGYYPLFHILLMGVCGAFLTGDLFNLYVWFEVMLMASFVLMALGGEPDQLRGAIKYVTINLLASALFLAAVGILYGIAGTLNMADLAVKLSDTSEPGLLTLLAMLFLIAFGIKAAIFPLFFWLPASYHTPPVAVSAVFAGLLTKVGVYALIRVFTLIFVQEPAFTHRLILVFAGLTMLTGVLGAAAHFEIRRILSFHIISQIGYMIMGLGLAGLAGSQALAVLALAGSVFYIVHHIVVKTNLFLLSGVIHRLRGSFELKELGGLYASSPWLSIVFLIPALSLAGLPPLSGFFAKLSLLEAGIGMGAYAIVAVALVVGLLTLFSMTKIWSEAFWKGSPAASADSRIHSESACIGLGVSMAPCLLLAALTVAIGLGVGPVFEVATRAAEQLLDRQEYIKAVLGERR
jgi:multicomponent Na+:H+ antiporter subunit D